MKNRMLPILVVLVVLLAGCAPAGAPTETAAETEAAEEIQLPTEEPVALPTETHTPEPTLTATATETETPAPVPPEVKSNTEESLCYFGPPRQPYSYGAAAVVSRLSRRNPTHSARRGHRHSRIR